MAAPVLCRAACCVRVHQHIIPDDMNIPLLGYRALSGWGEAVFLHALIHPSAGKRSSAKYTRSPSTLLSHSQTRPHSGPFRGSAIVPTISSVLSRAPKRCLPPYIRTRGQPYSPKYVEGEFSEVRGSKAPLPLRDLRASGRGYAGFWVQMYPRWPHSWRRIVATAHRL
jgi:hypothetical protein